MSKHIVTPAKATALREHFFEKCDDCDGAGHYLCPACGDSSGEACDAEAEDDHAVRHDDARHVPCDMCRGRGRVQARDAVADADLVDDLAATIASEPERIAAAYRAGAAAMREACALHCDGLAKLSRAKADECEAAANETDATEYWLRHEVYMIAADDLRALPVPEVTS